MIDQRRGAGHTRCCLLAHRLTRVRLRKPAEPAPNRARNHPPVAQMCPGMLTWCVRTISSTSASASAPCCRGDTGGGGVARRRRVSRGHWQVRCIPRRLVGCCGRWMPEARIVGGAVGAGLRARVGSSPPQAASAAPPTPKLQTTLVMTWPRRSPCQSKEAWGLGLTRPFRNSTLPSCLLNPAALPSPPLACCPRPKASPPHPNTLPAHRRP